MPASWVAGKSGSMLAGHPIESPVVSRLNRAARQNEHPTGLRRGLLGRAAKLHRLSLVRLYDVAATNSLIPAEGAREPIVEVLRGRVAKAIPRGNELVNLNAGRKLGNHPGYCIGVRGYEKAPPGVSRRGSQ